MSTQHIYMERKISGQQSPFISPKKFKMNTFYIRVFERKFHIFQVPIWGHHLLFHQTCSKWALLHKGFQRKFHIFQFQIFSYFFLHVFTYFHPFSPIFTYFLPISPIFTNFHVSSPNFTHFHPFSPISTHFHPKHPKMIIFSRKTRSLDLTRDTRRATLENESRKT